MSSHHCPVVADLATRKNDSAIAPLLHTKATDEFTLRRSIKSVLIDADISAKIRNWDEMRHFDSQNNTLSDHRNRLPSAGDVLLCSFILSVQITTSLAVKSRCEDCFTVAKSYNLKKFSFFLYQKQRAKKLTHGKKITLTKPLQ